MPPSRGRSQGEPRNSPSDANHPCPGAFQLRPVEEGPARLTQYRRVSLSGLVLCLRGQPSRFTRRLGRLTLAFFRPFRLPLVTPLREHHQLLLNSGYLRRGSLPFLSQGIEFTTGGHELGLDLGEIPDRRLLLVPLGPKLILGSL